MVRRTVTKYGVFNAGNGLVIPLYGAAYATLTLVALRSAGGNTTATIAPLLTPRYYYYDLMNSFFPLKLAYLFTYPDGGTTAHEAVSGAVTPVGGGNLLAGGPMQGRYQGFNNFVGNTVATNAAHGAWLSAQDNSGLAWTVNMWLNRANNTQAAFIYDEVNANFTNYIGFVMNANGTITLQSAGGTPSGPYTTPLANALPLNSWHQCCFTYASPNINFYLDGALIQTLAYTHGTGHTGGTNQININGNSQVSVSSLGVWGTQLDAGQVKALYESMFIDYTGAGYNATLGPGGFAMTVQFTEGATPGSVTPTAGTIVTLPLAPIYQLLTTGASQTLLYELNIIYSD